MGEIFFLQLALNHFHAAKSLLCPLKLVAILGESIREKLHQRLATGELGRRRWL